MHGGWGLNERSDFGFHSLAGPVGFEPTTYGSEVHVGMFGFWVSGMLINPFCILVLVGGVVIRRWGGLHGA